MTKGKERQLICNDCNRQFYNVDFKFCPYDGNSISWREVDDN